MIIKSNKIPDSIFGDLDGRLQCVTRGATEDPLRYGLGDWRTSELRRSVNGVGWGEELLLAEQRVRDIQAQYTEAGHVRELVAAVVAGGGKQGHSGSYDAVHAMCRMLSSQHGTECIGQDDVQQEDVSVVLSNDASLCVVHAINVQGVQQ